MPSHFIEADWRKKQEGREQEETSVRAEGDSEYRVPGGWDKAENTPKWNTEGGIAISDRDRRPEGEEVVHACCDDPRGGAGGHREQEARGPRAGDRPNDNASQDRSQDIFAGS